MTPDRVSTNDTRPGIIGAMSSWAGNLIRLARHDAGISQRELAKRAGTSQATLSAYESGKKSPGLETLARIVRAAGRDLRIQVVPYDDHDDVMAGYEASLPEKTRNAWSKRRLQRINQARKTQGLAPVTQHDLVGPGG